MTLRSMQARMTCGSDLASGLLLPVMAALLTTAVSGPSAASASAKTRVMSARFAMSPWIAIALAPARPQAATTLAAAWALP